MGRTANDQYHVHERWDPTGRVDFRGLGKRRRGQTPLLILRRRDTDRRMVSRVGRAPARQNRSEPPPTKSERIIYPPASPLTSRTSSRKRCRIASARG